MIDRSSGISMLIVHTEKGRRLLNQASSTLNVQRVDYSSALTGNAILNSSAHRPAQRDGFFADFKRLEWNQLEKKYAGEKWQTVLRRKLNASAFGVILRRLTGRKTVDQKDCQGVLAYCRNKRDPPFRSPDKQKKNPAAGHRHRKETDVRTVLQLFVRI